MLESGRIPMNSAEHAAVEKLIAEKGGSASVVSVSRVEPGEQGPLVVQLDELQYLVLADGTTR